LKDITGDFAIPDSCDRSNDGKEVGYIFEFTCGEHCEYYEEPSSAPTRVCDYQYIDFEDYEDNVQWTGGQDFYKGYGMTLKVDSVSDTAVTLSGNGWARLMDTANGTKGHGNDSPDESAFQESFSSTTLGNVLVIAEDNSATPVSAVDGGNITFSFETPVYEVTEIDLYNIPDGATVYVKENSGKGLKPVSVSSGLGDGASQCK
jgi:hypothetical protein